MKDNKLRYDLIVLGGGSAGLTAADFAAKLGVKVAILENHKIGGDCTWTGCIPSKSLLHIANLAQSTSQMESLGINILKSEVDFQTVMRRVRSVVADIYREESPEILQSKGIAVHIGDFQFTDALTLSDGNLTLHAKKIIVATGAKVSIPAIEGTKNIDYYTYETIWNLDELPSRLLVIGAGMVGVEFSQAFQRLGSQVTLIEAKGRILPNIDRKASDHLAKELSAEGVKIHTGSLVQKLWRADRTIHVQTETQQFAGDVLLLTTGRHPNVQGMNLEAAGVIYDQNGITVDKNFRTLQKNIFAVGDCNNSPQFTHVAGWQGFIAARNALLPGNSSGKLKSIPWVLFTDPQVAQVGLTESESKAKHGESAQTTIWPLSKNDRAHTEFNPSGYIQISHLKNGKILGATIVAKQAGEMIHEWVLAISKRLRMNDMAYSLRPYPSYGFANMQLAAAVETEKTLDGLIGKVLRRIARSSPS